MATERISAQFAYPSKYVEVDGSKLHYVEAGEGDPILFLHGVPASAYVWRNVIPHLTSLGRCIAPDLMGFGHSDKPNIDYSIHDHIKYVEKMIDVMGLKNVTLVMHGWGSIIGLDYAMRHQANCKGLVMYEAFLRVVDNDALSLPFQEQLNELTAMETAEAIMADGVSFVDRVLAQQVMRKLTDEEMTHYRQPFTASGTGKPLVQYLQELPRGDGQGDVDHIIANYSQKLMKSNLPKLLLYSVPGFITSVSTLMWAKENLPNLEMVEIGEELHLGQESHPQLLGESISVWLQAVEQNATF